MGKLMEWNCEICGTGERFRCGGGFLDMNDPELVMKAKSGNLGGVMEKLFGDGIPDGWTTFNEAVFYECPGCGTPVPGAAVLIDDGSGNWAVYHFEPEKCPSCDRKIAFWDDKVPMDDGKLLDRCIGFERDECPKCGAKAVKANFWNWD